ncbi:MAG: hypothetical protein J6S67_21850 [Methanobrevibacter sp.]|nr:hypothetical protein [Methanobrevibacter sp.]
MTIASEIQRIKTNIENAYDALENLGATMPATEDTDHLVGTINTISGGGGDEITAMNKTGSDITAGDKVWLNQESGYFYNFDVVGSLEVDETTSEISNFSTTNYLQLQTPFNPQSSSWEVMVLFITLNVTTQQTIFKSGISAPDAVGRFGCYVAINQSKFQISVSSDGTSWDLVHDTAGTYTVLENMAYWVKFGWNGTQYYLEYSLDGVTFTRDITVSSSTAVYGSLGVTLFGLNWWDNAYQAPFLGTIFLSGTKITVGGSDWWVPSITKVSDWSVVNFEKQNFSYDLDINGSPKIEYGVVSNFSSSNYLSKTTAPDSWNISDYIFCCKFNSESASSSQVIIIGSIILNTASGYCRTVVGSSNTNLFRISSYQTYWVKVVVSGTTQTFYYSTDGVAYAQCYTGTFTASTFNISKVGQNAGTYFIGSIDLNEMYLKNTSNNVVWRAVSDNSLIGFAKENILNNMTGTVKTILP